jgi:ketosteroid isomerase-like protein
MTSAQMFALAGILTLWSTALGQEINNKGGTTQEELIRLDHAVLDAEKSLNVSFLEDIFAPNYVLVMPNGLVYTKEKWLGILKSPDHPVIEVVEPKDVRVHIFGDLAILTDTTTLRSRDSKGQESAGVFRVFRVAFKQKGKWRIAAVELTPMKVN